MILSSLFAFTLFGVIDVDAFLVPRVMPTARRTQSLVHAESASTSLSSWDTPPFKTVMSANRAEIAVRIHRAATELNMRSVSIYGIEDKNSAHRWGADQSFLLPASGTPAGAYLNITNIVRIALEQGVEAIHPGYGFLVKQYSSFLFFLFVTLDNQF